MKVRAVKILALPALRYVTEGKEYDSLSYSVRPQGILMDIVDDEGDRISITVSDTLSCGHGVKWEIVE